MNQVKTIKAHPQDKIDSTLTLLAQKSGNVRATAKATDLDPKTIREWRDKPANNYPAIRDREREGVKHKQAEGWDGLASKNQETLSRTLQLIDAKLDKVEKNQEEATLHQLGSLGQRIATIGAIATDKASKLRGEATIRIEHRNPEEILKRLQQLGVIEGTAEEMNPPELPPAA